MTYQLTDDLEEMSDFHVPTLNKQMSTSVNRLMFALDGKRDIDGEFRATIRFLLKSFLTTHTSIIAVLRFGNEEKYDGATDKKTNLLYGPDAMSLVREQIEKVFTISLLCDDPERWHLAYLRDDWRRLYEQHLHDRDETQNLPRFREFHSQITPKFLERERQRLGITDEQVAAVEFKYYNFGKPLPAELKGQEVALFPTPGSVRTLLRDTDKGPFLDRLYKEYKFISGYTHAGHLKLQLLAISDRIFRGRFADSDNESYYETQILGPAITSSFISSVTASTEVARFFPYDIEILAALTEQWDTLRKGSLMARALWDLRAGQVLPPSIGK